MQPGAVGAGLPQRRIAGKGCSHGEADLAAIGAKSEVARTPGKAQQLSRIASVVIGNVKIEATGINKLPSIGRPSRAMAGHITKTAPRPGGQGHNPIGVVRFGRNVIPCQKFRVVGGNIICLDVGEYGGDDPGFTTRRRYLCQNLPIAREPPRSRCGPRPLANRILDDCLG